ncbi:hypothetical protein [Vallitalea guaymasensis]|uniref:Uncharacterized protein n=1 Tax=Vallitalea guaymasensis TaxID=1185412 RepID=A0A8J8SDJ9_9FIRM|nr:hypothetical protein [Vallitalea guaymasensis]QUH30551.1 hypothetical protein HYG85_17200 [Vallitalea guaymasensis]
MKRVIGVLFIISLLVNIYLINSYLKLNEVNKHNIEEIYFSYYLVFDDIVSNFDNYSNLTITECDKLIRNVNKAKIYGELISLYDKNSDLEDICFYLNIGFGEILITLKEENNLDNVEKNYQLLLQQIKVTHDNLKKNIIIYDNSEKTGYRINRKYDDIVFKNIYTNIRVMLKDNKKLQ